MLAAKTSTPVEGAKIILGPNMITLPEALGVFPEARGDPAQLQSVPFPPEFLYHCSNPENPHILFPGLCRYGNGRPLTIQGMYAGFPALRQYFHETAWTPFFSKMTVQFSSEQTCAPRWYLISKSVMENHAIDEFWKNLNRRLENGPWCNNTPEQPAVEPAVVYVYAWLLFRIVRDEKIFSEAPLITDDEVLYRLMHLYLDFRNGIIGNGLRSPGSATVEKLKLGRAMSVLPAIIKQ